MIGWDGTESAAIRKRARARPTLRPLAHARAKQTRGGVIYVYGAAARLRLCGLRHRRYPQFDDLRLEMVDSVRRAERRVEHARLLRQQRQIVIRPLPHRE